MGNLTTPLRARPTVYKGIEMRSRLEASYAAMFDDLEWKWQYEPRAFASEKGQYLPDFSIDDSKFHCTRYWEIKGVLTDPIAEMARMEIIWDSEPGAPLRLVHGPDLRQYWEAIIVCDKGQVTEALWMDSDTLTHVAAILKQSNIFDFEALYTVRQNHWESRRVRF